MKPNEFLFVFDPNFSFKRLDTKLKTYLWINEDGVNGANDFGFNFRLHPSCPAHSVADRSRREKFQIAQHEICVLFTEALGASTLLPSVGAIEFEIKRLLSKMEVWLDEVAPEFIDICEKRCSAKEAE